MAIRENLEEILQRVSHACQRVSRKPDQVQVLAVCKGQSTQAIQEALDCGIRLFGENRLQEAEAHLSHLSRGKSEWHFIGRIQKNKINKILHTFQVIQSVDSIANLEQIQKRMSQRIPLFVEINSGQEETKSGFSPEELKKALPYISRLSNVSIEGLMTIPPPVGSPEDTRPYFASLRRLKEELSLLKIPNVSIRHLSMGMSFDYEIAVEEGATMLRIGTALFGKRNM